MQPWLIEMGLLQVKDTNANWARRQIAKHGVDRYPTSNAQFIKLVEEVGELGKELNKGGWSQQRLQEESADVALALYSLCDKLHINLDEAIRAKVEKDDRKFA